MENIFQLYHWPGKKAVEATEKLQTALLCAAKQINNLRSKDAGRIYQTVDDAIEMIGQVVDDYEKSGLGIKDTASCDAICEVFSKMVKHCSKDLIQALANRIY